ncbi:hypothetical protein I2501_02775 [Streptacidiphilus sp. NEAU-YB345]|uniref:Uncharacterized protein n=1 Tax=Streptacidiphilus fuscans TaxID=2789292 RepID=A0A931FB11_9ACTN|nr:hypothetical protein [Streptacidiphilus fuscans]
MVFSSTDSGSADDGGPGDVVLVHPSGATGPGGSPVYRDESGIIQVEINDNCEARLLSTSAYQRHRRVEGCRRVAAG